MKAIFTDEDAFFKLFIDDLIKSLKTQWFFNTSPVLKRNLKEIRILSLKKILYTMVLIQYTIQAVLRIISKTEKHR